MRTSRERLETVFDLKTPDRTPILGGWIACPEHIMTLAGATEHQYWADPTAVSLDAYRNLGSDGLIDIFVPPSRADYRCVDDQSYVRSETERSLDDCIEEIDSWPDAESYEEAFDFDAE